MAINVIIRFLQAARSMAQRGMKKEQILNFARREFGKVSELLKRQIDDIYSRYKKPKTQKKGEVVPIKKQEGLVRRPEEFTTRKEYERYLDEVLGPSDDVFGSPIKEDLLKEWDKVKAKNVTPKKGIIAADAATDIVKKRTKDISKGDPTGEVSEIMEGLASIKQGGKGLDPREGVVRAAAREILNKNKIKIGKEDPIDLLRKTYGEAGLDALDAIGDDLLNTQTYGEINDLLTKNKLFDLKPKKVPGYDKSIQDAEELRMLDEFDIDPNREPNAYGGIAGQLHLNRTGYKIGGGIKLYKAGKAFWELLKDPKKIRAAIDDIFPTGDYKYDAEMAAEALVELNPKVFGGKLIDDLDDATRSEVYGAVIGPIQQQALVISKMKKAQATADEITKGVADVMQDTSKAGLARSIEVDNLKLEFPGITDDMINKILVDDNPQRIAEIKATMKEAMKMLEKGMGSDEIIQMFRKTPRTKQADGGLINILKL